jgi:PAS domain S-box-containing protein
MVRDMAVERDHAGEPDASGPSAEVRAGGESESLCRRLLESAPVGLALCRLDGSFVEVNPAFARIVGRTVEEILQLRYWDITAERYAADEQRQLENLERTGRYGPYEKHYLHKDGRLVLVRVQGHRFEHQGERYIWSAVEDVSGQRAAVEQRLEHLRFLDAMERINDAIRRAPDLDRLMGDVLHEMLSLFACDRAWLVYPCDPNAPSFRIMREVTQPKWPGALAMVEGDVPMNPESIELFRLALSSEDPIRCDPESDTPVEPTARRFGVQSQMLMALHPKNGPPWLFGLHHCEGPRVWTTEEAKIFRAVGRRMSDALSGALYLRDLRESEERLRILVEHAPEAILVFDCDTGRFIRGNSKAAALFKRSPAELRQLGLIDVCQEEQADGRHAAEMVAEAIDRSLADEAVVTEWSCRDAEGGRVECEVRMIRLPGASRRLIRVSLTDMTGRRQLEEQLRQAVKMQAIGTLAGGIAHDFNNLLVVIQAGSSMVGSALGPAHPLQVQIQAVVQAARRAADLTRQLLAFSRKQVMQPRVIDLNEVIAEVTQLVVRLIGEDVDLQASLAGERVMTRADRGQIGQVVVNLCTNARDAMPGGGTLRIETGYRALRADDPDRPTDLAPGRYATIEVADTGAGIPPEQLGRIFEPFFTTKEVGKGTGLGLSTVYGIVKQSGGAVAVRSEPGHGATFSVFLPAVAEWVPDHEPRPPVGRPSRPGGETILVVEDDANVASVVSGILRGRGYAVLEACDGAAAIALLERPGVEGVDLLLTDVVMPRMSGAVLAARLRERRPELKVLCMSGYESDGAGRGSFEVLRKPFSPEELAERVRDVLDRPARGE